MASKIEKDEERPNIIGVNIYLLFIKIIKKYYLNLIILLIIKDKGHLIHYVEKINNNYSVVFSIRHKYDDREMKYYYKLYSAKSLDLINFYNTEEAIIIVLVKVTGIVILKYLMIQIIIMF